MTPPEQPARCTTCDQPIGWIDCPTGGWWAHEKHPADNHDATASLRDQLVVEIVADALRPRPERRGLVNVMLDLVQPEIDQLRAQVAAWRGHSLAEAAKGCPVGGGCEWWPVESLDEHLARAHTKAQLVEAACDLHDALVTATGPGQRPGCPDPIECDHEAAAGQALAEADQLRAELDRTRAELAEADSHLRAIALVRVWRNEDGREFMFADDIRTALGVPTRAASAPTT